MRSRRKGEKWRKIKKQDEMKDRDGEQAERQENWFWECEPC